MAINKVSSDKPLSCPRSRGNSLRSIRVLLRSFGSPQFYSLVDGLVRCLPVFSQRCFRESIPSSPGLCGVF